MPPENDIIGKASRFVSQLITEKTPDWALYHNLDHTTSIVQYCEEIGSELHLSKAEMEILTLAAWFHDTGYIATQQGHEEESVKIAKGFLQERGYPQEKIDQVAGCIQATKLPPDPQNRIQEVLCDADTLHLGKKKFAERNNLFRMELERQKGSPLSNVEWLRQTIDFMSKHKFHTKYAVAEYNDRKSKNLLRLQEELRDEMEEQSLRDAKLLQKKDKLLKEEKPVRGIETMIRLSAGNHIHFSSIADHKASMLISTNSLMMTLIVTLYGRGIISGKPEEQLPLYVLVPIFILMASALITIIFAILSTRPKITQGTFSKEDIAGRKINLLFFGNFYKMHVDEYMEGMKTLMKDKDYMYDTMLKDIFYLGHVLGQKFRLLRISYNVFMFGLILTLVAFVIMYILG